MPEISDGQMQHQLNSAKFDFIPFDTRLNYEQLKTVDVIRNRTYGTVPYLISGPPGTGKTKTIVEIALQLAENKPYRMMSKGRGRILLCAPSDSAADTLVQRLKLTLSHPSQLLRLNGRSRGFAEVPQDIMLYCYIEDDMFSMPPFAQMMKYQVVVTTCRDASMLVDACLTNSDLWKLQKGLQAAFADEDDSQLSCPKLHWSMLMLDEAAQATEPESMIPLMVVIPPPEFPADYGTPGLVMAGDTKQLGPKTDGRNAALETSLFARLFERPIYRDHPLRRSAETGLKPSMLPIIRPTFTNLIRNYRSHPSILAVPSALFYHDTLLPEAEHVDGLMRWSGWRGRKWPVLFAPNTGLDDVGQDGGGWFNRTEARQALTFARQFVQENLIRQPDICIMSPFMAQVRLLRKMARSVEYELHDVNIGPLMAFQGLESRLVIVCTTRTRARFIKQDLEHGYGIINEAARFNVALTRAKEGLIVIGNPEVLANHDNSWRVFLSYCHRNGLWHGNDVTWQPAGQDGEVPPYQSRLERILLLAEDNPSSQTSGRRLGGIVNDDQAMWTAGIAAEFALRDEFDDDFH